MSARRSRLRLAGLAAVVLAVALAAPLVGTTRLGLGELLQALVDPAGADRVTVQIVQLRAARVALGLVVGALLAIAGASLQTLLGNPLATPYTLGVAAAGSLGAFAVMVLGDGAAGGLAVWAGAAAGAGADLLLLAWLAGRGRWGPGALILAGVTLNFVFAAGVTLLRLLADPFRLHAMERWILGGLTTVGWGAPAAVALEGLPAVAVLLALAPALDQLAQGDALAHGRGVPVARVRVLVLVAAVWITAACVAHAGPIAFVGLVVPHAVRLLLGPAHRLVLPASLLAGAGFLVACDAAARAVPVLETGMELPVGAVTALVGGPVFLALLARRRQRA